MKKERERPLMPKLVGGGRQAYRRHVLAGAVACVLALAVSDAVTVDAHTYPENGCLPGSGCEPDDRTHWWCVPWNLIDSTSLTALEQNANYYNGLSGLTVKQGSANTGSGCASWHDLWAVDNLDLGAGVFGEYECIQFNSAGECDRAWVRVDVNNHDIWSGSERVARKRHTWCHEWGHSVGLSHNGQTDCMRNDHPPSGAVTTLDTHNRNHIRDDI